MSTSKPGDFDYPGTPGEGAVANITTDFNLEDEYKADPSVPTGTYFANVTKVWFDSEKNTICWKLVLDGNEAVMSDGETPVDGVSLTYKNWLPNPGDENTPNSSGKSTKRQTKINMLKRFADDLRVDMSTPQMIQDALLNHEWVGIRCVLVVSLREYEGKIFNDIKSIKAEA